jgi:hypothetical protein
MSSETTQVKPFCFKIYTHGRDIILAVCDKDILGKIFKEGELVLHAKPEFYYGEEIGEEVAEYFETATIINLLGNRIVELAIKKGLVEEENVLEVEGVKHAQVVKLF